MIFIMVLHGPEATHLAGLGAMVVAAARPEAQATLVQLQAWQAQPLHAETRWCLTSMVMA